jgi:diguanylate cyclase (GGDEF)-like protein/PAS domain S-box-containing protein
LETALTSSGRVALLIWVALFAGLYGVAQYSFVLYHTVAELFGIVVAFSVFAIVWNVRRTLDNGYLLLVGIAFAFIGGLDLAHTLAYRGMNLFAGYDTNLPTQLWVAARGMQAVTLVAAPLVMGRRLKPVRLFLLYTVATTLLLVAIFARVFPDCYVEGVGVTAFKVASEFVICLLFGLALYLLWRRRAAFDTGVWRLLVLSLLASIACELVFALYAQGDEFLNFAGHFLRIIALWPVYVALVEMGLSRPYALLLRSLGQSEEKYRALMDYASDAILLTDDKGNIVDVNHRAEEILGYARKELLELNVGRIHYRDDLLSIVRSLGQQDGRSPGQVTDTTVLTKDGRMVSVDITAAPIFFDGTKVNQLIIRDNTERKRAEARLRYLSTHDSLTGLYNRGFFDAEITRVDRGRHYPVSVLMADVDGLKDTNDSRGHVAGDRILREAARLLSESLRGDDIVARIGGDEFAALLPGADEAVAAACLERVHARVIEYNVAAGKLRVALSLGMATAASAGELAHAMHLADADMYDDKRRRRAADRAAGSMPEAGVVEG